MSNPLDAIYAKFEAMDNQDVPLEQYPQAAVNALACAGWAVVPRDLPSDVLGEAARNGTMETGNPKHVWDYMISKTRLYPAPKPDSTATGGDVERRARELLAAEYELMGYKALVAGVREFPFAVLSDGDAAAIRAIIAALSAPKQVGVVVPMELTDSMRRAGQCQLDIGGGLDGAWERMLANAPQAAPQPVEAEGRHDFYKLKDEYGNYLHICSRCGSVQGVNHTRPCATPPPEQPAIALPSETVNALPEDVRGYIMWLETDADPAGTIRENWRLTQENKALRALVAEQPAIDLGRWMVVEAWEHGGRTAELKLQRSLCEGDDTLALSGQYVSIAIIDGAKAWP